MPLSKLSSVDVIRLGATCLHTLEWKPCTQVPARLLKMTGQPLPWPQHGQGLKLANATDVINEPGYPGPGKGTATQGIRRGCQTLQGVQETGCSSEYLAEEASGDRRRVFQKSTQFSPFRASCADPALAHICHRHATLATFLGYAC